LEGSPEERSKMLETSVERFFCEWVTVKETFDKWKIGEVAQQRTVASEKKLLCIESTEVPDAHLVIEIGHSALEERSQGNSEVDAESLPSIQSLPAHDANELRVLLEEPETGGEHLVDLAPPLR
jgi:hypothetical protein